MRSFLVKAKRSPSRIGQIRTARTLGRRGFNTASSRHANKVDKESGADTQSLENPSVDQAAGEIIKKDVSVKQETPAPVRPSEQPSLQELDETLEKILNRFGRVHEHIPEELRSAPPFREPISKKAKPGALNMGMTPAEDPIDDPEFEEDDITSMAHGQLEQHREFRHYARLAAWEMPLLTKMAKPFVPPTLKEVLRFRYTNYMGEIHPAEKKVVVEFCPADMPDLTDIQRDKLKKLAGSRWNPETDIIKISCEMFETQAQNKRYLGDLVEKLLYEARDPTDTFEDIPFDTRHHPIKVKPKFPVEWRMTDQRRAELEASRQRTELTEQQKELQGTLVDGVQQIKVALARSFAAEQEMQPQMVMTGKTTGKSKKLKKR